MENTKRLYRSIKDRVIGGVAGGIAEYFDIDPVIVRILFAVAFFAGGGGFLLYVLLWIFVREKPNETFNSNYTTMENEKTTPENNGFNTPPPQTPAKKKDQGGLMGGIIMITLGILFLIPTFIHWLDFGDLWPVLLIVIGGVIIYRHANKN